MTLESTAETMAGLFGRSGERSAEGGGRREDPRPGEGPQLELEVRVDRDRCMGSGQCVYWAPGVFEQDDEGISVVVDPRGELESKIVKAANGCPVGAISLRIGGIPVDSRLVDRAHKGSLAESPVVDVLEPLSRP